MQGQVKSRGGSSWLGARKTRGCAGLLTGVGGALGDGEVGARAPRAALIVLLAFATVRACRVVLTLAGQLAVVVHTHSGMEIALAPGQGRDKSAWSVKLVLVISEASPPRLPGPAGCVEALGKGEIDSPYPPLESFQHMPPGIGVGFPHSLSPQHTLRNPHTRGSVHWGPESSRKTMVLPNQGVPRRYLQYSHR